MHKITEIKKQRLFYKVIINDDETIEVEPVIYMKYRLKLCLVLDEKTYKQFVNDNLYERYKRIGLNRLKKLQTKHELYTFLIEKGGPKYIVDQIIFEFSEKKYIDDDQFTKIYVELNKQRKGPLYLEKELQKKGVSLSIIRKYIYQIDEAPIVEKLVLNKIRLLTNKKTKRQIMIKIKTDLLRLGFHREVVEAIMISLENQFPTADDTLLEKAYDKARRLIKKDILDYEDRQKIFKKLYQKGFSTERIKNIIDKYN